MIESLHCAVETGMLEQRFLRELSEKLAALMPMASELRNEVRTRIEQQVQASFIQLDILSRSEFEQQLRALEQAQSRIQLLEQRLRELENELDK
ncbi:MAG: accessory factor UbiK family protein [Gammaproteobacteria bacterium]